MNKTDCLGPRSDLLRTFVAVAEAANVTLAADAVGRTQSAVSVQIRKLETHLSVRLFDRGARGVMLTPDGKKLLPAARKALKEIDGIAALFGRTLAGTIRVGLPDDYSATILEQALADFSARHVNVEVYARSSCTAAFPDAIRKNELDVAVYSGGPIPADEVIYSEPTVFTAGAKLDLDGIAPVPLALFDRDCWWRNVATDALDAAGIPWRIAYLSENFLSVRAAIGAGLGVGILAQSTLEPGMRVLGKREGFPRLPPSELMLLKSQGAQSDIVDAMEDAILSAIRGRLPAAA